MSNLSLPTKILKGINTSSSIGMFARDTGGCLLAKLAVSRSKDEAKEIGFAELSESALFYFSAPFVAKATSGIFSSQYKLKKGTINTPINEIKDMGADKLKDIKLAKFGQIMTTFAVILPIVFAIAPVRNILTYANSGKENFTSVVGLKKENEKVHHPPEIFKTFYIEEQKRKKAEQKVKKLITKLGTISLVSIGAITSILAAAKNDKVYDFIKPIISKTVKSFDFTKTGDLKLAHYGAFIYPISIASYFYASRDKYERQENARRFSITVPLLFFGEKVIENPIHKCFDKLFNTKIIENNVIKSYDEILKLSQPMQKQYLKAKNWSYGLTFLINTMAIGVAVGILNRIATKKRYNKENNVNKESEKIKYKNDYDMLV